MLAMKEKNMGPSDFGSFFDTRFQLGVANANLFLKASPKERQRVSEALLP